MEISCPVILRQKLEEVREQDGGMGTGEGRCSEVACGHGAWWWPGSHVQSQIPPLLPTSIVISGNGHNFSNPQLLHLQNAHRRACVCGATVW